MHPDRHPVQGLSLAEAIVAPGEATHLHRHHRSEEIYHVVAGQGSAVLGDQRVAVGPGDTLLIPPETPHRLINSGGEALKVLCACSPAYRHEDTELLPDGSDGR
jgi:mannose-6-phosphate isomerase-like protein (cupin superfamily)